MFRLRHVCASTSALALTANVPGPRGANRSPLRMLHASGIGADQGGEGGIAGDQQALLTPDAPAEQGMVGYND